MNRFTWGVLWLFCTLNIFLTILFFKTQINNSQLQNPLAQKKNQYEVFGFAPYWTINKLQNVNWNILTTLAYFGVPVLPDGTLDTNNVGYEKLNSDEAANVFKKAHASGTRVVLTVTQMDDPTIDQFLSDTDAQKKSISQTINLVKSKHLDGINVDFEYTGDSDPQTREKFTHYIGSLSKALHSQIQGSTLSVSVYATAVSNPKIYDIKNLSDKSDFIFMMAYDFATSSSTVVIPTSPLYGHREGKYWYDVSTAVSDFLGVMPANKLILGLPWYGYDYPVNEPGVKVSTYQGYSYYYWWRGRRYIGYEAPPASTAQTYSMASAQSAEVTGWDDAGKVGWRAYKVDGIWRMIFLEDAKSLKIKYDFAKDNNLAGVGVWALGFDSGSSDMWKLLTSEFGTNIAYAK